LPGLPYKLLHLAAAAAAVIPLHPARNCKPEHLRLRRLYTPHARTSVLVVDLEIWLSLSATSMASSSPPVQSEYTFAATTDDSPTYTYPLHEDSQPSPNGMSAAAILATLSDSRPPTSHADDAEELEEDDTEAGGISLANEWEGMNATPTVPVITHPPSTFAAFTTGLHADFLIAELSSANMDYQATALEGNLPPPPAIPLPLPNDLLTFMSSTAYLLDSVPSAYEEHLNVQDVAAFLDITTFVDYHLSSSGAVKKAFKLNDPPAVVTREDLAGEQCDFQGIDWSGSDGRASVRNRREAYEKTKIPHKAWRGMRRETRRVGVLCREVEDDINVASWGDVMVEPIRRAVLTFFRSATGFQRRKTSSLFGGQI
jgi:hypothetical protein